MITPDPLRLQPCGKCRRCLIHDDPAGCLKVEEYERWLRMKADGEMVAERLSAEDVAVGQELYLDNVPRAYAGLWRKNADGTWNQLSAPDLPLIINCDPAHVGFCVGADAVGAALAGAMR